MLLKTIVKKPNSKKLGELSSIRRGYSFRSRIEPEASGDVSVVQVRNIQADGVLDMSELVSINFEGANSDYWLHPGDIAFGSRGGSLSATLIPDGIGKAIAASSVLIIRPTSPQVTPEYLVWFLNYPSLGQRQLMANQEGSNIQMIKPKGLADIKIHLPPIEVQCRIGALSELQRQENRLAEQLQAKRTQYMDAVLMKCMKGELA